MKKLLLAFLFFPVLSWAHDHDHHGHGHWQTPHGYGHHHHGHWGRSWNGNEWVVIWLDDD